jgi:hydroxymethylpyrimidine pyrophosphatase-like HAD family hydrolase
METDYTANALTIPTGEVLRSIISSGKPPEEVLSTLDQWGIDWYVTEGGSLMIKSWQVAAEDFVDPQKASEIRSARPLDNDSKQLEWLSKNLERLRDHYGSTWIAIHDEKVVADGRTVSELMEKIKGVDRPFITFIPSEPIVWTLAYGDERF